MLDLLIIIPIAWGTNHRIQARSHRTDHTYDRLYRCTYRRISILQTTCGKVCPLDSLSGSDCRFQASIVGEELDLDQTFYRLLAFVLIFIVVKFGLQLVASMFDFLKYLPVLGFIARILGAVFGFIEFYILIFLVLYLLAMLPIEFIQNALSKSCLQSDVRTYAIVI